MVYQSCNDSTSLKSCFFSFLDSFFIRLEDFCNGKLYYLWNFSPLAASKSMDAGFTCSYIYDLVWNELNKFSRIWRIPNRNEKYIGHFSNAHYQIFLFFFCIALGLILNYAFWGLQINLWILFIKWRILYKTMIYNHFGDFLYFFIKK